MDLKQHNINEGDGDYGSTDMDFVQEANEQREAFSDGVHTCYVIKNQPHEDSKYMRKIAHANFEIQRKREEIDHWKEALEIIEVKHKSIRNNNYRNSYWENWYGIIADTKSRQLACVQVILRKDTSTKKEMSPRLPEEDELIKFIKTLNHQVKYKMLSTNEQKKLMKQIKEIEATRAEFMANVSLEAKKKEEREEKENQKLFNRIVDKPVKEWIKSQVKSIKILKEMQLEHMQKVKRLRENLKASDAEIRLLKERINTANTKIEKAHQVLLKSGKFRTKSECFLS